jgi:hypothetical protein
MQDSDTEESALPRRIVIEACCALNLGYVWTLGSRSMTLFNDNGNVKKSRDGWVQRVHRMGLRAKFTEGGVTRAFCKKVAGSKAGLMHTQKLIERKHGQFIGSGCNEALHL